MIHGQKNIKTAIGICHTGFAAAAC